MCQCYCLMPPEIFQKTIGFFHEIRRFTNVLFHWVLKGNIGQKDNCIFCVSAVRVINLHIGQRSNSKTYWVGTQREECDPLTLWKTLQIILWLIIIPYTEKCHSVSTRVIATYREKAPVRLWLLSLLDAVTLKICYGVDDLLHQPAFTSYVPFRLVKIRSALLDQSNLARQ